MDARSRKITIGFYLPLMMALLVTMIYTNGLKNPLLREDRSAVLSNPLITEDNGICLLWGTATPTSEQKQSQSYQPIAMTSYWINYRLLGPLPAEIGYRIGNLIILAGLSIVTAFWIASFTGHTTAWLVTGLFTAHPIIANCVHVISGRAQLLALLGIVSFALIQRRAMLRGQINWAKTLLAIMAAIIAFGSDTTGLLLIPLAAIQAWLGPDPGKSHQEWLKLTGSDKPILDDLKPTHWKTAAILLITGFIYGWGRYQAGGWNFSFEPGENDLTGNPLLGLPWLEKTPAALSLVTFYARQIFWPSTTLNTIPQTLPTWTDMPVIVGASVLVLAILLWISCLKKRSWLSLAIGLGLGQYLLVGHLLLAGPLYAENRLALPAGLGAIMISAALIHAIIKTSPRRRAVVAIAVAAAVVVMGGLIVVHNAQCANIVVMRRADLEKQVMNPTAMFLYGDALAETGKTEEALVWIENAVARKPDTIEGREKLAELYLLAGRPGSAIEQYEKILSFRPQDIHSRTRLAAMAMNQNHWAQAEKHLDALGHAAMDLAEVTLMKAQIASARGDLVHARQLYEQLLNRWPEHDLAQHEYQELIKKIEKLYSLPSATTMPDNPFSPQNITP